MNKELNSRIFSKDYAIDRQEQLRLDSITSLVGRGKEVLDVGCRDGTISKIIEHKGNKVETVEISDYSIRKAREKGLVVYDLDLNTQWAECIPKDYDVVFAGEVLEHIFETDSFLQNIRKVLKPGGFLVLSTPNLASLGRRILLLFGMNPVMELTTRDNQAGHVRYFVFKSLKTILNDNGFSIVEFTSDVVNFNFNGTLCSNRLAKLVPTLGRSLIIKAAKDD